jgi:Thioredoxin
MAITRERFEQGLTYEGYKAQMTRNRDRIEATEASLELPAEDLAFFAQLPRPVHAVVLAEDWCGDVMNNLPVLAKLSQAGPNLHVRVFLRDQNLDIMDQYLKDGQFRSIPVFAFHDEDLRDIGHWIERPAALSRQMGAAMEELFATAPELQGVERGASPALMPEAARERVGRFYGEFRARTRHESDREVVRELRELLQRALS